jgi:hypothetical protein
MNTDDRLMKGHLYTELPHSPSDTLEKNVTKGLYILICIQQDATLHSLFYLETALHVSGGTITHHQEGKQLYLQHLLFVTPLRLSAAIVEKLEPVRVCCGWRTSPTAHSNQFQLFHDNGR